jgi:DNA-binding NtrC family response regulator
MEQKHSILLVDDDREFRKAMENLFLRLGFAVTAVRDGQEAVEVLYEKLFDLVISEVRLPRLDGIKLMEEINRRRLDISVIYLTNYGEIESYMDVMNMGAFDYINKPVKEQRLMSIVTEALRANLKYRIPLQS